jgi:NAD(P)-dependent dehydrogenase (short-subunit alcohol dehydrogenase family)
VPEAAGPVTLLTGASGGLGSVVLPMFIDAGHRVAAVALDWPQPSPSYRNRWLALAETVPHPNRALRYRVAPELVG